MFKILFLDVIFVDFIGKNCGDQVLTYLPAQEMNKFLDYICNKELIVKFIVF